MRMSSSTADSALTTGTITSRYLPTKVAEVQLAVSRTRVTPVTSAAAPSSASFTMKPLSTSAMRSFVSPIDRDAGSPTTSNATFGGGGTSGGGASGARSGATSGGG